MANPWTERELRRLRINTREDQLPPEQGGRQLRGRKVPPVPPPRAPSIPTFQTEQKKKRNDKDATHVVFSHKEQYRSSSTGMDTSDVESIEQKLRFATAQLKECHQIADESPDSSTVEDARSPSPPAVESWAGVLRK